MRFGWLDIAPSRRWNERLRVVDLGEKTCPGGGQIPSPAILFLLTMLLCV